MNIKDEIKKLKIIKENMPDLIIREINISLLKKVYIILCKSLVSEDKVNDFILKYFSNKKIFNNKGNIDYNVIPSMNIINIKSSDEIIFYILSGFTIVLYKNNYIAIESKAKIDRAVSESNSEPSIKGPKDSLTENYETNVGLIRRRIKDKNLFLKEYYIGNKTKTKVGIMYINNLVEDDLVKEVNDKISSINCDGILDSYFIKELIRKENNTLFSTIQSKEKPDELSLALLKGKVIVIVENSPNVLIIPTFFIDFFHNSEDYYQKPFFVSFVRIIRIFAFFLSILLPGFYIALTVVDHQILPTSLLINFTIQRDGVPFPAILEAFILMFTFEILYEGDARTPPSRGTSLSVLGALVLGDAAVNAGLVSPIMVIVTSLSAISSLLFVYADLQGSIRFWRYLIMILSSIFGIIGFIVGVALILINLCGIKSFGKPYLIPLVPFYKKEALSDAIFKTSIKKLKMEKSYLTSEVKK